MKIFNVFGAIAISLILCTNVAYSKGKKPRRAKTMIYEVKKDATPEQIAKLNDVLSRHDLKTERKLLKGKLKQVKSHKDLGVSEEEIAKALEATGAVNFAEPDYLLPVSELPNDPYYLSGSESYLNTLGAPNAWQVTTGLSSVRIAVCDTGVNVNHIELAGHIVGTFNTITGGSDVTDNYGHGTPVAGILASAGNNGIGVSGMTWRASLLVGKITESSDGYAYSSDMAECIRWSADNGAKVVNLSYRSVESATVNSAGQYLEDRGGILFASLGNEGSEISINYESIIAVGATGQNGASRMSWSNYGAGADLFAPGSGIKTTSKGGGYKSFSGTSAASPVAAAVAALIFSANPGLSVAQIKSILLSTTIDLGDAGVDNVYGSGLVQAGTGVLAALGVEQNMAPVANLSASKTLVQVGETVNFDGQSSYDQDGTIASYQWSFGDGSTANGALASHSYATAGQKVVKLTVKDDLGATSETSINIQVEAVTGGVLHVSSMTSTTSGKGKRGSQVNVSIAVVDHNGNRVSGVLVSGQFSGLMNQSVSATSDSNGIATLSSSRTTASGDVVFTVNTLSNDGWDYDSSANNINTITTTLGGDSGGGSGGGSKGGGRKNK